jgi:hypothetical protein
MRPIPMVIALGLVAALAQSSARAQSGNDRPQLHVGTADSSCYFELHPELTQAEFAEFASELGAIMRPPQLGDTATLGKHKFDVSLQYTSTRIDDSKGAWNNTMSHPTPDHYLGESIALPRVVARFGVSDRVDAGAWGTMNPQSNYGVVGVDTKIALLRQGPDWPATVSIRPSISSLIGPSDVWVGNASIDLSVGRAFGPLSPYVGVTASSSLAVERSSVVDLEPASAGDSIGYAGVAYSWRKLVAAAEVEKGDLTRYGFRLGTRF